MKRAIFSAMALLALAAQAGALSPADKPQTDEEWTAFLTAMAQVESNGRDTAQIVDVNGKTSYGCLQIQDLYLADSRTGYAVEDLADRQVSFAVARKYLERYGRSWERRTGGTATCEILARIHNGGPRGAEKSATESYWAKVSAELSK